MSVKQTDLFTKSDISAVLLLSALVLFGGVLGIHEKSRAVISPEVVVDHVEPSILSISSGRSAGAPSGAVTAEMLARYKININTAPADSLALLPGIGPNLAGRIVDYRRQSGPFGGTDDLSNVRGIGPARLAAIRDMIAVGDK